MIAKNRRLYAAVAAQAAKIVYERHVRIASQEALVALGVYGLLWGDFMLYMSRRRVEQRRERYFGFFAKPALVAEVLDCWVSSENSPSGQRTVNEWATKYVGKAVSREANSVTSQGVLRTANVRKTLIRKFTKEFDFANLCADIAHSCPTMTHVLKSFSTTTRQENHASDTSMAKKFMRLGASLLSLLGERSQQNNYVKSVFSLYLYASGAQRQIIAVLSRLGLCSSYTALVGSRPLEDMPKIQLSEDNAPPKLPSCGRGVGLINRLAINQRTRVRNIARTYELGHVYDNYNINYKTAEQTLGRRDTQENGTCATVFPLFNARREDMRTSDLLTSLDQAPCLSRDDILLSLRENEVLDEYLQHSILRIIVMHGGTSFQRFRDTIMKSVPSTPEKIPLHKTEVFPLPAMNIDESSTTGNADVLDAIFREVGHHLDSPLTWDAVKIVFGDQLSVSRQRGVTSDRTGHDNPQRTHANVVQGPGFFHYLMAAAGGTLETHFGNPHLGARDPGSLSNHNNILGRKPIVTSSMPPYRVTRDLIFVSLYARILHCLELVTECNSLEEYAQSVTLERLKEDAKKVLQRFANPQIVAELRQERKRSESELSRSNTANNATAKPEESTSSSSSQLAGDMVFENAVLFNRDALHLFAFTTVVREGDSGMILIMLKLYALAYRAMRRPRYSLESMTQLHNLLYIWPKPLRDIIMQNWVINPTGKPNTFVPVDLMQEHFIFWIKVIYGAQGSNASPEWLEKISPCIGILRELATQLNEALGSKQGNKHQTPELENDIRELIKSLRMHSVYSIERGRTIEGDKAQVPNVQAVGLNQIAEPLQNYNDEFERTRRRRRMTPLIGDPLIPRSYSPVVLELDGDNSDSETGSESSSSDDRSTASGSIDCDQQSEVVLEYDPSDLEDDLGEPQAAEEDLNFVFSLDTEDDVDLDM
ncbi:hypothetical protein K474DRAFT_1747000 [Panus rudis PR-1116 ss-1]|nr:hypothetical protein K474DRAFT_1747000 [Panus rudis PR-1116 ss-1]